MARYAVGALGASRSLAHHTQLLGQVHNGDIDLCIIAHTLRSPSARITAHIEQTAGMTCEYNLQGLLKRVVRIEMVESEPTLLHLFRQLRQSLIDGGPVAKHFQAFRFSILQSLLQMEHTDIIEILIEIHIGDGHLVVNEETSWLGDAKLAILKINGANDERRLQQYLRRIVRNGFLLGHLINGQPLAMVCQKLEDAPLGHDVGDRENDRSPGNELGKTLGVKCL